MRFLTLIFKASLFYENIHNFIILVAYIFITQVTYLSPLTQVQTSHKIMLNPQAPVAQKIADEVVFRHFQGEGVEFFLIGPH